MKAEILEYFKDINFYYNECMRYESLSQMLDELIEETESSLLDKISAEIKEKTFTEEIFDEDVFRSIYTENMTREVAEEESVIETEIVKLSDILEIIEKHKGVSE